MTNLEVIETLILMREGVERDHRRYRRGTKPSTRDEWWFLRRIEAFDNAIAALKVQLDVPRGWVTTPKQYHEDD